MRGLIDFINKLMYGEAEASSASSPAEPVFFPIAAPAHRNDVATRPTRRVEDHELLKFHKTIDMAG